MPALCQILFWHLGNNAALMELLLQYILKLFNIILYYIEHSTTGSQSIICTSEI